MCDTVVVVGSHGVWFAKNSDRDPNEAQHLDWRPRQTHATGGALRCTWIEIPQVRETHAAILSRPFWMWGAEMGVNEHGVAVGNEAVFTRQPYASTGLTGMDLVRLALERAATAKTAVDVVVELMETHGQGGGCGHENRAFTYHNSFLIADPVEAYVVETAGKLWAVERVQGARSISNGLTIDGFAARHSDVVKTAVSACRIRRRRTQAAGEKAEGFGDLFRMLRDHGEDREIHYRWYNGALNAACAHAGGLLAATQTTASWASELRPGDCRHWATATAAPCTGLFKPVRVDQPIDLGPAPDDRFDDRSLWWRHEQFHRRIVQRSASDWQAFQRQRDAMETRWLRDPPPSAEAFAEGDRLLREWTRWAREHESADCRPVYVRRYWNKRNQRCGLPIA